jgi:hypothetical protein
VFFLLLRKERNQFFADSPVFQRIATERPATFKLVLSMSGNTSNGALFMVSAALCDSTDEKVSIELRFF